METINQNGCGRVPTLMPEDAVSERQFPSVTNNSPPAAKIELFRSLFRGREDVYPRRFESRRTGKAGYAPACASEAFLFRRLQTLPETTGCFRLNVKLPISFGGKGKMEVDFLCAEAGVVIELDGAQHSDLMLVAAD